MAEKTIYVVSDEEDGIPYGVAAYGSYALLEKGLRKWCEEQISNFYPSPDKEEQGFIDTWRAMKDTDDQLDFYNETVFNGHSSMVRVWEMTLTS